MVNIVSNEDYNLKEQILSACDVEGAVISEIARRHDVSPATVYGWRYERKKQLQHLGSTGSSSAQFIELVATDSAPTESENEIDAVKTPAAPTQNSEQIIRSSAADTSALANSVTSFELRVGGVTLSLAGKISFSCAKQLLDVMEGSC